MTLGFVVGENNLKKESNYSIFVCGKEIGNYVSEQRNANSVETGASENWAVLN